MSADAALSAAAPVPPRLPAGSPIFVRGLRFTQGCQPSGDGAALVGVRLFVVQNGQRTSVALVNPSGADNGFATSFGIPPEFTDGPATVVAQTSLDVDATALAVAPFDVAPGSVPTTTAGP